MNQLDKQVKHIGEQGLLQIIKSFCPAEIIGDDAAVLNVTKGHSLVVTTDVLVDRVHFSDRTTSPEDVGWRAVAANLSDLAAMGATPLGITVGLALPGEIKVNWVERLYQGMTECLNRYQTFILGGDICRSPVITISITALGQVLPQRVIRRDAAKPGDKIVVTGYHGCSRAGLELLLHPEKRENLDQHIIKNLIQAHQRPNPRLDILELLWEITSSKPVAGMDSSDGLADAIVQICRFSGVGASLEYDKIPFSPDLKQLGSFEEMLEWVLYGGEDFELVLCLAHNLASALVEKLGQGAAIIGEITADKNIQMVDFGGFYPIRELNLFEGFQHF